MKLDKFEVQFQPDGLRITVPAGTFLSDAMKTLGMKILMPCGGEGTCGKCAVEIHPEPPAPGPLDIQHLTGEEIHRGMRLACQTRVDRAMTVLIAPGLRIMGGKILVDGLARTFDLNPSVIKKYVELPPPTLEDQVADLFRVRRALNLSEDKCPDFNIELLREIYSLIRDADFRITAVMTDGRLVGIEPGNTVSRKYGIAFDIGTTTVVGTIFDLTTGSERSFASRLNGQVVHGEDTISRIKYVMENPDGGREMREKILSVVNEIIVEASEKAGIEAVEIYEAVFVGNTTMSHLFLGLDPSGLSQIPFVPVTNSGVNLRAGVAGVAINPLGNVFTLPNIAGFVGSDTVGVMLACDFLAPGLIQLAVDVGTNGELALRKDGVMMVCSTAAGPALEGAALSCGMRAAEGAVEHVKFTDNGVECEVIGGTVPIGLCGSGIIDIVAELLDYGIIDQLGRLLGPEEIEGGISFLLSERIIEIDGQKAFLVSKGNKNGSGRDVLLTQKDIRQIQLAKGAISAGITLLLKEMSLNLDELDEILLAGAFGNYIRKKSAQRIGLLPPVPEERIRFVGNAASTGAKMALLSIEVRKDADRIRDRAKHIELAALPDFMTVFMDNMMFP
jgi:uncharacterized 2Fe-2S/4Fe-4S cluster protein (DUF4445 family)